MSETETKLVVFRRSPCLECSLCSFGNFPRRLKYKSRRFGTQCRFHRPQPEPIGPPHPPTSLSSSLARSLISYSIYYPPFFIIYSWSPRTMEPTLSSETSAFILQTPGKFPKEHRLLKPNHFTNTCQNSKYSSFLIHKFELCVKCAKNRPQLLVQKKNYLVSHHSSPIL